MSKEKTPSSPRHVSRRGFLQSTAAAATGAAVVAAPAIAVKALEGGNDAARVTEPSGPPPREPLTAYLRSADKSEVTVMSGTSETTYRDPVLAQRLLDLGGTGLSY